MFTGIIEELGRVSALGLRATQATRITVEAPSTASRLKIGDSVAVSGVCLTAVEIGDGQFSADLAHETLERTSLGGHIVQGHVDGTGKLLSLNPISGGDDWRLTIEVPAQLTGHIIPQGSITIEGISLTVAAIEGQRVEIAIIPHTYQVTNLRMLPPGNSLNIETDVLAKYAEKILQARSASRLNVADLIRQGF